MIDPTITTRSALDRFRARIADDAAVQRRLAAIVLPEPFVAAAVAAAADVGIDLPPDAVLETLRPDPLGIARFAAGPPAACGWPGADWLPAALVPAGGEWVVDWKHFGALPLAQPFFEQTLRSVTALPINRLLRHRTPLSALVDTAPDDLPVPDGFVFHLSRCGSTLVAQMLAARRGAIVVSEAAPIDAVVRLAHDGVQAPLDERVRLLRAMVGALGRDRIGGARHFIVKLDSWHTLALPLFRLAFPDTPWVFLYRDPVEILVSQMRRRGLQTVPGAIGDVYGIADGDALSPEEYTARVLARVAAAVLDHRQVGGGLAIDYADLPGAVETLILPHFGIVADADDTARMAAAARRDAKAPLRDFAADTAIKRQAATPAIRAAAEAHAAPVIHRLRMAAAA